MSPTPGPLSIAVDAATGQPATVPAGHTVSA